MTDTRALSSSTSNGNPSNPSSSTTPPTDLNNVAGLTAYVNTIFHQMEEKFMAASDQVMNRMNDLGKKIDTLESNIGDIISTLPTEDSSSTSTGSPSTGTTQQQSK